MEASNDPWLFYILTKWTTFLRIDNIYLRINIFFFLHKVIFSIDINILSYYSVDILYICRTISILHHVEDMLIYDNDYDNDYGIWRV